MSAEAAAAAGAGKLLQLRAGTPGQFPHGALHLPESPGGAGIEHRGLGEGGFRGLQTRLRHESVEGYLGDLRHLFGEGALAGGAGEDQGGLPQGLPFLPDLRFHRLQPIQIPGPQGGHAAAAQHEAHLSGLHLRQEAVGRLHLLRGVHPQTAAREKGVGAGLLSRRGQAHGGLPGSQVQLPEPVVVESLGSRVPAEPVRAGEHEHRPQIRVLRTDLPAEAAVGAGIGLADDALGGDGRRGGGIRKGLPGDAMGFFPVFLQHLAAVHTGAAVALQAPGGLRLRPFLRLRLPGGFRLHPGMWEVALAGVFVPGISDLLPAAGHEEGFHGFGGLRAHGDGFDEAPARGLAAHEEAPVLPDGAALARGQVYGFIIRQLLRPQDLPPVNEFQESGLHGGELEAEVLVELREAGMGPEAAAPAFLPLEHGDDILFQSQLQGGGQTGRACAHHRHLLVLGGDIETVRLLVFGKADGSGLQPGQVDGASQVCPLAMGFAGGGAKGGHHCGKDHGGAVGLPGGVPTPVCAFFRKASNVHPEGTGAGTGGGFSVETAPGVLAEVFQLHKITLRRGESP